MRRPPARRLIIWSIPAWGIVGALWMMAVTRQPRELLIGLGIGLASLLLAGVVVTTWVAHNRRLAHRREAARGGRRGAPDVPLLIERDARGRAVRIAPGADSARVVVVMVTGKDGDTKVIAPEASA
jgi:hypothetical protein